MNNHFKNIQAEASMVVALGMGIYCKLVPARQAIGAILVALGLAGAIYTFGQLLFPSKPDFTRQRNYR